MLMVQLHLTQLEIAAVPVMNRLIRYNLPSVLGKVVFVMGDWGSQFQVSAGKTDHHLKKYLDKEAT